MVEREQIVASQILCKKYLKKTSNLLPANNQHPDMRKQLIYQEIENPDGVIFNPELLDDEQNWAYLRATQT